MVAIQIRGTSGSGKTWIIKKLMNEYKFTPVIVNEKIFGYKSKQLNVFIPGRYETACGGCDTIKTQDEICRRVKLGIKNGYSVLFEGLLSSHLAERFFKLYSELNESNVDSYFIFLNTPLSTCEENINKRRLEAGKSPKKAKTVESHYHSTKKSRENMKNYGVPTKNMPILSSEKAYLKIKQILLDDIDCLPF